MKFSIIVPVYKVEEYINQCIDSILKQSYTNFELVLVDDGSPDLCPQICDEFAAKDKRIKVIHKENGGLSSARNVGIDNATGDYLVFVDSDDWIEKDALDNFYSVLKNNGVDLLMTVKTSIYDDRTFQEVDGFEEYLVSGFNKDRAIEWILYKSQSVAAVNKILKREFVMRNDLRFLEGALHEDYDWTFKLCLNSTSFAGFSGKWYNYRMVREGSITNKVTAKNITSLIITAKIYYDLYAQNDDCVHKEVYHKAMDAVYISLNKIKRIDSKEVRIVVESLKENKTILKYARKMNQKIFLLFSKLFGIRASINLLRLIP